MSHSSKLNRLVAASSAAVFAATASPALAYVGPGAGLSAIGSVLSFIGVVLLMIVGFVWYPVKRMLKRRREEKTEATQQDS